MSRPPDQAQRDRALAVDTSFIVQAPAGAGKTGLLVRRLLKLLAIVKQPEEVLAITFTRKATEEMRLRVIEALQAAKNGVAFEPHEADLKSYAGAALARDAEQGWQLLDHPRRLRILTIDSLASELVRQMPWSSRFGAMPQIDETLDARYELAALDTLQSLDQAPKPLAKAIQTLLVALGGNLQQLVLQVADMLKNRQQWLPLLMDEQARLSNRQAMQAAWRAEIETHLQNAAPFFGLPLRVTLIRLGQYAANHLLAADKASPITTLADVDEWPLPHPDALAHWQALAELLLTKDGEWRKAGGVNVTLGFPPKQDETAEFKALVTQLAEEDAETDGGGTQKAALHVLRSLPPAEFSDQQWAIFEALLVLLPAAASELFVHFGDSGRCDFSEITRRAIDALGSDDAPSELALVQDYRTQHILMDEFQDTSPEQLELLERLIAGWQPDDGRTLFLVGDPMQSIYRFRDADVRVFLRVCEQGIGLGNGKAQIQPEPLVLCANFRSSPDIIDWVNRVFPNVLPQEDQFALGAIKYASADPQLSHPGSVHFHPIVDAEAGEAAQAVVAQIRSAQAQLPPAKGDEPAPAIAILAASRTQLAPIARALADAGIEFESIELEGLAEQPVSDDLFALSRAILHPFDRIAWLAVLRAPWCGLTLAELDYLAAQTTPDGASAKFPDELPIESLLEAASDASELAVDSRTRLKRFTQAIKPVLAQRGRISLNRLTRQAWFSLNGPACHDGGQNAHAERFLAMLDELETSGQTPDADAIARALAEKRVSTSERPVKLLTMHKAKGLEFDTVMLVGLDRAAKGRKRFRDLLNWEWQAPDTGNPAGRLLVAPITPLAETDNPRLGYLSRIDAQRGRFEAGRLLYVATTRARRALHLFAEFRDKDGELAAPGEQSLLSLIWAETEANWKQAPAQVGAEHIEPPLESGADTNLSTLYWLPTDYAPPPLAKPIVRPAPRKIDDTASQAVNKADPVENKRELAQQIGTVVHQLLETADIKQLESWQQHGVSEPRIAAALAQQGAPTEALEDALNTVTQCLSSLASDDTARWIFSPDHRNAQAEWRLQSQQDGASQLHIIDRSFIDASGIRWIIDFKTGTPEADQTLAAFLKQARHTHFAQLQQYAALLRELEPEHDIRCGLYFPFVPTWLEVNVS